MKPEPKKGKGVMDFWRPITTTEPQELVFMVQYYRETWNRWSHRLYYLTEATSSPKGRKVIWNEALHESFK